MVWRFLLILITYNVSLILFLIKELAIISPQTHDILKALERWIDLLKLELNSINSLSIISNLNLSNTNTYQSMLNLENTPFMYRIILLNYFKL